MHEVTAVSRTPDVPRLWLRTLRTLELSKIGGSAGPAIFPAGGKPLALLAFLSCAKRRSASRDEIAELLWSTRDTDSAYQSIRQARSALKKWAGADVVMPYGADLVLSADVRSDRDQFLKLLADGHLTEAVALYDGEFCGGFHSVGAEQFERWAADERVALMVKCAEALARLAMDAMANLRATDALGLAARLQQVAPADERHWCIRLEALLLKHDDFGARIAAAECESWLRAEEFPPSVVLQRLIERASKVSRTGSDVSSPPPLRQELRPDLIGREKQFSALMQGWAQAKGGKAACILLTGTAGLGKSRLLHDVHERLAASRARVVAVRALSADTDVRYSLVSRLAASLAQLRGAAGISSGSAAVLVGLNPTLGAVFPSATAPAAEADAALHYIEALEELVGALTEDGPVAILIDDVHWGDPASLQIIASLGERLSEHRAMLVLALRSQRSASMRMPASAIEVALDPLTDAESEGLIGSIASVPDEPEAGWHAAVSRAAGGSPLLILETLRLAMDAGHLAITDGMWRVVRQADLMTLLSRRAVMDERISRLSARERALALIFAVAGRPLNEDACRQDPDYEAVTAPTVAALERRDVIVRDRGGWSVAHDVLAETLRERASVDEMAAAREVAGQWLLRSGESVGLRSSLRLFVQNKSWSEGAAAVTAIVVAEQGAKETSHVRARRIVQSIEDAGARAEVRRRLPVSLRLPVRAIVWAAGIVMMLVASVPYLSRGNTVSEESPRSQLVLSGLSPSATQEAYAIDLDEHRWDPASPIDPTSATRLARWPIGNVPAAGVRADGVVAIERFYPDSGGVDVALWHPDGSEERLTAAHGDDVASSWSPDGKTLFIESSRSGLRGHRAVYAVDVTTRSAKRLSSGGSATVSDASPYASPDGRQVAFSRNYFDRQPSTFCTVASDGKDERCRPLGGRTVLGVRGWINENTVVVLNDSAGVRLVEKVDAATGAVTPLTKPSRGCSISPSTQWILCELDDTRSVVSVAPASTPNRIRHVIRRSSMGDMRYAWRATPPADGGIASVQITSHPTRLPVGVGTLLDATVLNREGERIAQAAVRWSLPDTSQGTVTDGGVLTPFHEGRITVRAAASNRTMDATLDAVMVRSEVLEREKWSMGYQGRWRSFGVPTPLVIQEGGQHYFLNNGDGDQFSGAYRRTLFPLRDGLWMESELSTPITATQWQVASFMISEVHDLRGIRAWDHVTGPIPAGLAGGCSFLYPSGEGFTATQRISPAGDVSRRLGYPVDRLSRGGWYRVLIQLFPDGRCGMAINGTPIYVSSLARALPDSGMFIIEGNSFQTKILVGETVLGKGVKGGVCWRLVEGGVANPPCERVHH